MEEDGHQTFTIILREPGVRPGAVTFKTLQSLIESIQDATTTIAELRGVAAEDLVLTRLRPGSCKVSIEQRYSRSTTDVRDVPLRLVGQSMTSTARGREAAYLPEVADLARGLNSLTKRGVGVSVQLGGGKVTPWDPQVVNLAATKYPPPPLWHVTFKGHLYQLDYKQKRARVQTSRGFRILDVGSLIEEADQLRDKHVVVAADAATRYAERTYRIHQLRLATADDVDFRSEDKAGLRDELAAPLARLDYLCALPDNWDGYGASKVYGFAADIARDILFHALATARAEDVDFVLPRIAPCPNGEVHMEWGDDRTYLEIDIGAAEDVPFLIATEGTEEESTVPRRGLAGLILKYLRHVGRSKKGGR